MNPPLSTRALARALVTCSVALVAFAAPGFGYVIFLKDGTQIITEDTYRVDGDQAIFERENGVTSSIPLAEIDVERTERENRVKLSGAQTIQGLEKVDAANAPAPPPKRDSLADLLRRRGETGGINLPEPRKRPDRDSTAASAPSETSTTPAVPRTAAGFADLMRLPRRPFADGAARDTLRGWFADRGIEVAGIHEGTAPRQPFIELVAPTESAVFETLSAVAGTLLEARTTLSDTVEAFELLLLTRPGGENRGGQFQLTPELAELLVNGDLEPSAFFLRYVEF